MIGVGAQIGDLRSPYEWIAASLHLRPGHSGGPMVDVAGRLIGINTTMNGPDVGVAVPVDVAKRLVQAVYEKQHRADPVVPQIESQTKVVMV